LENIKKGKRFLKSLITFQKQTFQVDSKVLGSRITIQKEDKKWL